MNRVTNNANTSKYVGTEAGHTNGTATHGRALVYQTLTGFNYDYDPASRRDREEDIRVAATQLVEDMVALKRKIDDHTKQYDDGIPEDIAHTLITLLTQGADWARDLDVDYSTYLDKLDADANAVLDAQETTERYEFNLYYGREPADFREND